MILKICMVYMRKIVYIRLYFDNKNVSVGPCVDNCYTIFPIDSYPNGKFQMNRKIINKYVYYIIEQAEHG